MAQTAAPNRPGWRERWARRENERRRQRLPELRAWDRDDTKLRQMLAGAEGFRGLEPEQIPPTIKVRPRRGRPLA